MKKRSRKPARPSARPAKTAAPFETELTCYVHEGWAPRIAPASPKRPWMDATPDSYAYRCLPLAIANAHGWEVLCPVGFSARWNGGVGAESVEIIADPGADPDKVPVSLFGSGTITFHIEGIFRTSPGWNLWVSGPPNGIKDAIAPLGGVIETDWAPYTFTMNWRFTRPGHWIRFEEIEPFCFFFPTPRGIVDKVQPQLRPMEDAPELLASFSGWSKARADFQAWVKQHQPKRPTDQWQKLYYRGLHPHGAPGPADHESKLRPQAFQQAGSRPVCPVAPAPTPAPASPVQAVPVQAAIDQTAQILAGLFGEPPSDKD